MSGWCREEDLEPPLPLALPPVLALRPLELCRRVWWGERGEAVAALGEEGEGLCGGLLGFRYLSLCRRTLDTVLEGCQLYP